jgi:hypothetical protein
LNDIRKVTGLCKFADGVFIKEFELTALVLEKPLNGEDFVGIITFKHYLFVAMKLMIKWALHFQVIIDEHHKRYSESQAS